MRGLASRKRDNKKKVFKLRLKSFVVFPCLELFKEFFLLKVFFIAK